MKTFKAIETAKQYLKKMGHVAGALVGLSCANAYGQSLHVVDDSYVDSANPSLITDSQIAERKRLVVTNLDSDLGELPAGERIAYFKHEVDTLPDQANSETISKASIRIWVSEVVQEGTLLFHTVTQDWDERSLNYDNKPNISPFFAAINITAEDANHWITVEITKSFASWLTLPGSNFGIAVTAVAIPGNQSAVVVLSSKEGIYVDIEESNSGTSSISSLVPQSISHSGRCDKKSGNQCDDKAECENKRENFCKQYKDYAQKAKYYYGKAVKYKKYCYKNKKYCAKYQTMKTLYNKYTNKAKQYKKLCLKDCSDDCHTDCNNDDHNDDDNGDNGGDNGDNQTTISINASSGHPSEIEVAIKSGQFDLLAKQYFASNTLDNQAFARPEENTLIEAEIDLNVESHVMYMATLSLNWEEQGEYTLQCESTIYTDNGNVISAPVVEKSLTVSMSSDIINISASSFGEPLIGNIKVEVYCEIYDSEDRVVSHTTNGNVSAWSVAFEQ